MGTRDPRVDAYIAKSPEFARPILRHLRELVHAACPEVVEELKWNSPHFNYKGMFCGMAAFKQHCIFGFWKGSLVTGKSDTTAMGSQGRITTLSDLPSRAVLVRYIKKAKALNDSGLKMPRPLKHKKPPVRVPTDLAAALKRSPRAAATFAGFSPSNRREYVEWVTDAKQVATRSKRVSTAVEWMAEGKPRNWKYM